MKQDELDNLIVALKPAAVAELAEDAYARRADVAQVRARAGASAVNPRVVPARRPVRRLALAGGVAAVAAAAALAVAMPSDGPGADPGPGAGHDGTLDTRTFLLASAKTAAEQSATRGACWYKRTRMWQDIMPFKPGPGVPTPARKSMGRPQNFQVRTASSVEDWACAQSGTRMRFGTNGPLDIKVTFPTKKDEAAWKAAGSPPLDVNAGTTVSKPRMVTYAKGSHLVNPVIGSHEIEWKTIAKLPATDGALESYLRRLWQQDRRGGAHGYTAPADFGEYVFVSAWDLFMAPTTPGTRAALYRILARTPSVRVTGQVVDRLGRPGVAVTAQGTSVRLVVDRRSAQLLDFEDRSSALPGKPAGGEYLAFESQGWVNKLGAAPAR
ncbi:hypothetical protein BJY14_006701 [Actinomadura luteofluorescens]|uniref:CU044_5270 family protein n=1 Tax=Actinomadura luteofluorescens TaxID=46163 RepID=A0A7Y9EMY8_9ACTN|nr:hypothetical protein [Actinomadura luteofluorescens]NYD50718.1 hypothetical protein [Actinomadura luteofluorescens]